ncbi:MAG: HAD family hydrolase [Syntrophomonadaceae bacterium]|jgi:putative hydrolase of the HAD superfamily|nr:HAD family hydrolase [Syntrophomonadaceae bacterium]
MFKAITFDFWDTLYKVSADINWPRKRVNDFYDYLGNNRLLGRIELVDIEAAFEKGVQVAYDQQRKFGVEITSLGQYEVVLAELGLSLTADRHEELFQVYKNFILQYPPSLNANVVSTLEAIKGRYKLGLICNTGSTPGYILRNFMEKDKIISYFDLLVFSDEQGCAKPSRRIFSYTLRSLQVYANETVHVGDDPLTDVIGAKKAGMRAAWLAPKDTWTVPEADYHLNDISEIISLLR